MQDRPIGDFRFPVRLRVYDGSAAMFNVELSAELFELLIVELPTVVSDDGPRETESIDDRLP